MTRRCFSLALAAAPAFALPAAASQFTPRLLLVRDLGDFARRYAAAAVRFRPARVVVRHHLDFWPGAGVPRRWEAWLEDDSGRQAVRILADPDHAASPFGRQSPGALALAGRISGQWLDGSGPPRPFGSGK